MPLRRSRVVVDLSGVGTACCEASGGCHHFLQLGRPTGSPTLASARPKLIECIGDRHEFTANWMENITILANQHHLARLACMLRPKHALRLNSTLLKMHTGWPLSQELPRFWIELVEPTPG